MIWLFTMQTCFASVTRVRSCSAGGDDCGGGAATTVSPAVWGRGSAMGWGELHASRDAVAMRMRPFMTTSRMMTALGYVGGCLLVVTGKKAGLRVPPRLSGARVPGTQGFRPQQGRARIALSRAAFAA